MEGRPGVTGSGIRRAEDASGTAKVRKSQTPTVSIPKSRLPCLPPGSSSFQPGSRGGEESGSQASPGLPSPAWPRARNPAPLQPGIGEIARQGATCQRALGEQEGRTGAFCTLWPGCSFLPLSTHPQCAPFPDITRTQKPRHARVRPSHRPRSID